MMTRRMTTTRPKYIGPETEWITCHPGRKELERRARDSNPQPVSRRLISSQVPNHSATLRTPYILRMRVFKLSSLESQDPTQGFRLTEMSKLTITTGFLGSQCFDFAFAGSKQLGELAIRQRQVFECTGLHDLSAIKHDDFMAMT